VNILIGTRNKYKATEMASFLSDCPEVRIRFLDETDLKIKIKEDQQTLKKNAEKKAIEISRLTNWYVLASDGGVDIPGLGERWNMLKNQRTVGEDKTDLEKAEKLLSLIRGLKKEKRRATYRLALALAKGGKLIWSTERVSDKGYISEKLINKEISPYRWMGHLWYYPKYKKVFNKLSEGEKEEVRKQGIELKRGLEKVIREIITKK
jgi:inosine/xanthosine triphosphate pyrophosphatase family protein